MKAFAIDRFGEDGSLRELPDPVAGPGELLVRVTVAGVNPVDWKIRDGAHGPRPFPLILGVDFAGVIEAAGSGVADFRVGERIFGAARAHGSYAERTVVPTSSNEAPIAKIPAGLSDAVAALLPIAGLTALATLARLDVPRGESLLIYGATGGVGAIAVQIAHARGIHVIGTARSGKEDALRALGADEVIVYDRNDVIDGVKAAHPDGITGVIDLVNDGVAIKRLAEIVRNGGRVGDSFDRRRRVVRRTRHHGNQPCDGPDAAIIARGTRRTRRADRGGNGRGRCEGRISARGGRRGARCVEERQDER